MTAERDSLVPFFLFCTHNNVRKIHPVQELQRALRAVSDRTKCREAVTLAANGVHLFLEDYERDWRRRIWRVRGDRVIWRYCTASLAG